MRGVRIAGVAPVFTSATKLNPSPIKKTVTKE